MGFVQWPETGGGGGEKTNKHKQLTSRECPGNGWGSNCSCVPWGKGKHTKKIPGNLRTRSGQFRDNPGTVPWNLFMRFLVYLFLPAQETGPKVGKTWVFGSKVGNFGTLTKTHFLGMHVASAVDAEFLYRVRIVDRGLIAATLFAATVPTLSSEA